MTTTYTESQERMPFDWRDFLNRARASELNPGEKYFAISRAQNWTTCACGILCAAIPRRFDWEPWDRLLSDLGLDFLDGIKNSDWVGASNLLDRIEARSAEILKTL